VTLLTTPEAAARAQKRSRSYAACSKAHAWGAAPAADAEARRARVLK
jgi:hypothetical protein